MLVSFSSLANNARLWSFQASRVLTPPDEAIVKSALDAFCGQWTTHDEPIRCGYRVVHHVLVQLAIDINFRDAGGCAVDTLHQQMQALGNQLNTNFFAHTLTPFLINNQVHLIPLEKISNAVEEGLIKADSMHIHTTARSIEAYENQPLVACADSWLSRYVRPTVSG